MIQTTLDDIQEHRLRTRHLRVFSAAAVRHGQDRPAEAPILTSQPLLSEGLKELARRAGKET